MAVSIGRRGFVNVAMETSPGSNPTTFKTLPFTAQTFHNVVDILDDEAAKGIRERARGSVVARSRGEGDMTILLDVENAPYLLFPALGTMTSQCVPAGGFYQHIITRKASNPPRTICLDIYNTYDYRRYTYGTVNTCELTFSDGYAELTASLISKKPTSLTGGNIPTATITDENVMAFKDAVIYFGSDFNEARSNYKFDRNKKKLSVFRLTINNNAEAQYVAGASSPEQIAMGQFEVGGDYTLFFEDATERGYHEQEVVADRQRAMVVVFTGGGSGATQEKLVINIPKFHLTDRGMDTAPAGFVTENPTYVSDFDSSADYLDANSNGSLIVEVFNDSIRYTGDTLHEYSYSASSSSSSSSSGSLSSSSSSSWSC